MNARNLPPCSACRFVAEGLQLALKYSDMILNETEVFLL
jgi:hypothetical protein